MDFFVKFAGTARVMAGEEVIAEEAAFRITCWMEKAGDRCEGHVDLRLWDGLRLMHRSAPLVLLLPDGRELPFEMVSATGRVRILRPCS